MYEKAQNSTLRTLRDLEDNACFEAARESPIPARFGECDHALDELRSSILILAERIDWVLTPGAESGKTPPGNAPVPRMSPLTENLEDHLERIRELIRCVRDLNERIEL
jgi:hypothetical protein